MRAFSFGGGVQSMAALVLAAQGKLNYDAWLFSNVGCDSENPKTLEYFYSIALPYAEKNGLKLIELKRKKRDGSVETLLGRIISTRRSIPLPARMSNGAPGRRTCTSDFKIRVIAKWLKRNGATAQNPAVSGLGISLDEFHRARTDSGIAWQVLEYPLIDLRMTRQHCINLISKAGLPVPSKSSCYFCPFHSPAEWQRLKREQPDLFKKSVEVEKILNAKLSVLQKDKVWLHPSCKPLDLAVADQAVLWDKMGVCESGYCFI